MTNATNSTSTVRVAVTQAEPCWFDLEGTVQKTIKLIAEATENGAQLVAFPECWIPGYPLWIWKFPVRPDLLLKYQKNSLRVDSAEMKSIQDAAKKHNIVVVLGYSERSGNSLYMGQAVILSTGELSVTRRKLKPTHMERTVFGDASGGDQTLHNVAETSVGRVSGLLCWEHLQPLLKYNTISQGPQIHVAAWPPLSTPEDPKELYSMSKEGCQAISQVFAMESQSFVLHTGAVISDAGVTLNETAGALILSKPSGGSSIVFAPDGKPLTTELKGTEEGIVYCDLELDTILISKGFVDSVGHYSRPDILSLNVDVRPKKHVTQRKPEVVEVEGVE
ncbi:carbon-nitrogen hydrolase [Pluteus cervinus]|uniref:Carbon-nitrogen hydrolase n=1 Tax=Pluteus cervinus TaxID=181527 RepID=A0ACD3AH34_9AGAR|nr:carbon-nitrogen hydrolase [Pluteus cervinus]